MYVDVVGNIYQSYEQAQILHGAETLASLKAQDDYYLQKSYIQQQDEMEARGGPSLYSLRYKIARETCIGSDECICKNCSPF